MATKKKKAQAGKAAPRNVVGGAATATLKRPAKVAKASKVKVQSLPKGQERDPDGVISLRAGEHSNLRKGNYRVHNVMVNMAAGDYFIATLDVNWVGFKQCTCGTARSEPVHIKKHKEGPYVIRATCHNKKCKFGDGMTYIWVMSANRIALN